MLYSQYETNKDSERAGVRKVFAQHEDGREVALVLARAGGANEPFNRTVTALMKPHRIAQQKGTLPEAIARKVLAEAYATTVVRSWENVTDKDGNEIPFTKENVQAVLIDLPDFFDEVQAAATSPETFKEGLEGVVKN